MSEYPKVLWTDEDGDEVTITRFVSGGRVLQIRHPEGQQKRSYLPTDEGTQVEALAALIEAFATDDPAGFLTKLCARLGWQVEPVAVPEPIEVGDTVKLAIANRNGVVIAVDGGCLWVLLVGDSDPITLYAADCTLAAKAPK